MFCFALYPTTGANMSVIKACVSAAPVVQTALVLRRARRLGAQIVWRTAALLLACHLAAPASAQGPVPTTEPPPAAGAQGIEAIPPAEIPARADADEVFIQAIVRRYQAGDAARRSEEALVRQSAGVRQLTEQSNRSDLALLSVSRLETLQRHWLLYERELSRTRANLSQATRASAEDAASLANRRALWLATKEASPNLTPALVQRMDELIGQIDRAENALSTPLGKLLDLGRRASALSTQVERGVAALTSRVEDQDRGLLMIDKPPLWQALNDTEPLEPVNVGFLKSMDIELSMARAYDAANSWVRPALFALAALLLPVMLWL
jgi:potassium efflux system protein